MYRTLSAPINLQIEITEKCNHCCRHCYNFFRHGDNLCKSLSRENLQCLVEEIVENKVSRIVITGGEPLIESVNLIWFAQQLFQFPWISISLNSNLVLLTEKIGKQLNSAGVTTILTSLTADTAGLHDWITQRSGSWQKTISGIKLAKKLGFRVLVNMVLTKWNIDRVYQTGKLVQSLEADKFGATRACAPTTQVKVFRDKLISVDEVKQSLDDLLRLKGECGYAVDIFEHYPWCVFGNVEKYRYFARRKCLAGVTSASIGANGQLRPCGHSSKQYGSVIENGLATVWRNMSDWRLQKYVGICKKCKYLEYCSGGCAVEAENSGKWKDHHCVGESGITKLPSSKKVQIQILPTDKLYFPNHVELRNEKFGGMIFSGDGGIALLDKYTYKAIQAVFGVDFFTAEQLVQNYGFEIDETLITLSSWISKNLIQKGGKNENFIVD